MRLLRRRRVSGAAGLGRGPSAGSRGQAEHGAGRRAGLVGIPEPGHARPRAGRGGNGRPPGNAMVLFSGLRMRYVASYLLAALGGNTSPSAKDIKKILDSVGIEADDDRLNKVGAPCARADGCSARRGPSSTHSEFSLWEGGVRAACGSPCGYLLGCFSGALIQLQGSKSWVCGRAAR